jgi:hypothetical protein
MTTRREFVKGAVAVGGLSIINTEILSFDNDATKFLVAKLPLSSYETADAQGIVTKDSGYLVSGFLNKDPGSWGGADYRGKCYIPCNEIVTNPTIRIKDIRSRGHINVYESVSNSVAQLSSSIKSSADELLGYYEEEHGRPPKYIMVAHNDVEILTADEPKQLKVGFVIFIHFGLMVCHEIPNELNESHVKESLYLGMKEVEDVDLVESVLRDSFKNPQKRLALNEILASTIKFA